MIFINPWAFYDSKDLPEPPNFRKKKEPEEGCLGAICGFIIATVIHVLLFCLCFTYTEGGLRGVLMLIESIIIYPIMVICLINLSIKIEDKICNKKKLIKK
jgi:hypothetical protein